MLKGLGAPRFDSCGAIEYVHRRDGTVMFTLRDSALRMPMPAEAGLVLPHAPIVEDLSLHRLSMPGLKDGNYDVWIDGQKVATLPKAQLEAAWNMTRVETPMMAQANQLMAKVIEKNDAYFHRWREIQIPAIQDKRIDDPDVRAKLQQADQRIAALEVEINALRKPRPHRFELRPARE